MRVFIQPGDGTQPLIKAIGAARSRIEIVIFRFDQREIENALANAVSRGVSVHALIASRNRAGEENLRDLELRLLGAGVIVARTSDDLVRYHGKLMIVDRRELYLMAFNLTHADIERSRSFGVTTRSRDIVREAVKLFEADTQRSAYEPGHKRFLVSPLNARKELARFIQGARKELVIYDPQVSDRTMIRLLVDRARAGVQVRIIGRLTGAAPGVQAHKLPQLRLHTRTMVRDRQLAFVGSQSLREMELDARREVGLIFRDAKVVSALLRTFEEDWDLAGRAANEKSETTPEEKIARKVAKAMAREMPAVGPMVSVAVREVAGEAAEGEIVAEEVETIVKSALKEAVKEAVRNAVEDVILSPR